MFGFVCLNTHIYTHLVLFGFVCFWYIACGGKNMCIYISTHTYARIIFAPLSGFARLRMADGTQRCICNSNHTINQLINQSLNQTYSQGTNQATNQSNNLKAMQAINQSFNQTINQPINQSNNQCQ